MLYMEIRERISKLEAIVHRARSSVVTNVLFVALAIWIGVGAAVLVNGGTASAYSLLSHHQPEVTSTDVTVEYDWSAGITQAYQDALEDGMADWEAASLDKDVTFDYDSSSSNQFHSAWTYGTTWAGQSSLTQGSNSHWSDWDIELNTWKMQYWSATERRSTAGHELGHVLGLDDLSSGAALMNTNRTRSSIYTPFSDDRDGVDDHYDHSH